MTYEFIQTAAALDAAQYKVATELGNASTSVLLAEKSELEKIVSLYAELGALYLGECMKFMPSMGQATFEHGSYNMLLKLDVKGNGLKNALADRLTKFYANMMNDCKEGIADAVKNEDARKRIRAKLAFHLPRAIAAMLGVSERLDAERVANEENSKIGGKDTKTRPTGETATPVNWNEEAQKLEGVLGAGASHLADIYELLSTLAPTDGATKEKLERAISWLNAISEKMTITATVDVNPLVAKYSKAA